MHTIQLITMLFCMFLIVLAVHLNLSIFMMTLPIITAVLQRYTSQLFSSNVPRDPAVTIQPTKKEFLVYEGKNICKFYTHERKSEQKGWNCFDVAAGFQRKDLVEFALKNAKNSEFRDLLAPEIAFAAQLSTGNIEEIKLPRTMRTPTMLALVAALANAQASNDTALCETMQQALMRYCSTESVYIKYINEYYGKNNWVSFTPPYTSIVDIAAHMLEKKIVIYLDWEKEPKYYETSHPYEKTIDIILRGNHFVSIRKDYDVRKILEDSSNEIVYKQYANIAS